MSNYINAQNQTILWNTINRIPAFLQLSPPKRDLEFKRITEHFYRKCAHKPNLSVQELQDINRQTVMAFVSLANNPSLTPGQDQRQGLRQGPVQGQGGRPPLHPNSLLPNQNPIQNPIPIPIPNSQMFETRQEKQERAFQDRQNMYAQMTEKPNPPVPEMFKETVEDVKITNMDELIASYQKQRNLEIPIPSIIPPVVPSIIPSISASPSPPITKQENKKITFLEGEAEINSLEIQDLDTSESSEKKNLASAVVDGSEKKNLAWNINLEETRVIEDSYLQELEKRIVSLEKQIQFLSEIKTKRRKQEKKEIQEPEEPEFERKEIEEIIESVILSIERK